MVDYTYITINDPSAGTFLFGTATDANGINNLGQIVGDYSVPTGLGGGTGLYGYVYDGATYTTIGAGYVEGTRLLGINNFGTSVGLYSDFSGLPHSFVYSAVTGIIEINDPLSVSHYYNGTYPSSFSTFVNGVNDAGQLVGYYYNDSGTYGFLHSGSDYTTGYVTLNDPLATGGTIATGVNNAGEVIGYYTDGTGTHGFLYNGVGYTTVDAPTGSDTKLIGINNVGQIVGSSSTGIFIDTEGVFASTSGLPGTVTGINDEGQLVGDFSDSSGSHGFIATPTAINHAPTIDSADSIFAGLLAELNKTTGSSAVDYAGGGTATTPSGVIAFTDVDPSSRPTASIDTVDETAIYQNSAGQTFSLAATQIAAFEAALSIVPEPGNTNTGKIDWTYKITDSKLDFLGVGETVTVTAPVQISDGQGGTITQDIVVTIQGVNDNPIANPDLVKVENSHTAISAASTGVLTNDIDPDSHDALQISAVNGLSTAVDHSVAGKYGSLTLDADGSYTYVENLIGKLLSDLNISEDDTFRYTISDGHGGTASSTLTFDTRESPPPVAKADMAVVQVGGTVSEAAQGVLTNDTDANNYPLTVSAVSVGQLTIQITQNNPAVIQGSDGTLTLNADGSYKYVETTANISPKGAQDVFHYTVSDGHGGTAQSTLDFFVTAKDNFGLFTDLEAAIPLANQAGLIDVQSDPKIPKAIAALGNDAIADALTRLITSPDKLLGAIDGVLTDIHDVAQIVGDLSKGQFRAATSFIVETAIGDAVGPIPLGTEAYDVGKIVGLIGADYSVGFTTSLLLHV